MTEVYTDRTALTTATIPAELKSYPSWIVWRYEEREGTLTKVLYTPGENTRAKTNDLRTWRTFLEAVEAYQDGEYAGLGFVFSSGDPFTGIDLDGCRDPETGVLEEWATKVIEAFDGAYVEVSPSGEGVHIIFRGELPQGAQKRRERNGRKVEAYSVRRFFTITGRSL